MPSDVPPSVDLVIEVPRFGFAKRNGEGHLEFLSPLPCPYNYGSIPGSVAPDGDPLDVVVLGARLTRGTRVSLPVRGVIEFWDGGVRDPKVVCSRRPLTARDRAGLAAFFRLYGWAKDAGRRLRGRAGASRWEGWMSPVQAATLLRAPTVREGRSQPPA